MEGGQSGLIADVAQGDADVSQEAAAFRAKDRRAGEASLEGSFIEREEFNEIRLSQIVSSVSFHDLALAREAVPGANCQTIIATINSVADGAPKLDRNRAFEFDREVGDAAAGVELEGGGYCGGWAGLKGRRARIPEGLFRGGGV